MQPQPLIADAGRSAQVTVMPASRSVTADTEAASQPRSTHGVDRYKPL